MNERAFSICKCLTVRITKKVSAVFGRSKTAFQLKVATVRWANTQSIQTLKFCMKIDQLTFIATETSILDG